VCNGRRKRRCGCGWKWRYEYSAARAQRLGDETRAAACEMDAVIGRAGDGSEFSDADAIERSALPGRARRLSLFYCDPGQSQQKGGCERNHVDLRKLLPKGRGISLDALERAGTAVVMSQLNSEPRPSLGGLSPIRMLLAARGADGAALLDLLGIEEIPCEGLDLTPTP
jgi:IS30 family transposase